ncbi:MAG: hypothetical protein LBV39_02095 [Bacteroidales bacterium]|nr:hypothetical protein [Bacteroidales bacterium]
MIVQECTRFKIFSDNGVKNYIPFYGLFVESKKNKEEKNSKNNHSKTKKDEN